MIDYYSRLFGSSQNPVGMMQQPSFLQDPYAVQFQEADDSPMTMGQQGGGLESLLSGQREPLPLDEQPNDGIVVSGPWSPDMMPRQQRPDSEYTLDNTNDVKMMREANRRAEEAADYKGMFGVKGTLRDVLGVLGDAFLVQGGAGKVYEPRRQQERAAASMAGMSRDPYAAGERTIGVDAALGRDIIDQADQQAFRRQQLASQNAARQSLIDKRDRDAAADALEYGQSVLFQPGAIGPNGVSSSALQALQFAANAAKMPLEAFIQSIEESSPEAARLIAGAGLSPKEQTTAAQGERRLNITEEQGNRRLNISQQNANTSSRNAATSSRRVDVSDPNARARVINQLNRGVKPENLSEGDKLIYDDLRKRGTSGSSGVLDQFRNPPASNASQPRFGPPRSQ